MPNSEHEQRRQYYRLHFPRTARLTLTSDCGHVFHIVDLSERGLRVDLENADHLDIGETISGEIVMHNEYRQQIHGEVLRRDWNAIAVVLDEGIPPREMFQEQRYINQTYPLFVAMERERIRQFSA